MSAVDRLVGNAASTTIGFACDDIPPCQGRPSSAELYLEERPSRLVG